MIIETLPGLFGTDTPYYQVKVTEGIVTDPRWLVWCERTFGPSTWARPDSVWREYLGCFYFKREEDATLFLLRWAK